MPIFALKSRSPCVDSPKFQSICQKQQFYFDCLNFENTCQFFVLIIQSFKVKLKSFWLPVPNKQTDE